MILESNSLVENADVELTGIKESSSNRRRRSSGTLAVDFVARLSIRLQNIEDFEEIQSNLTRSIQTINPTLYESFDEDSFSTVDEDLFSTVEPKILPIKVSSESQIDAKIGKVFEFTHIVLLIHQYKSFIRQSCPYLAGLSQTSRNLTFERMFK